MRRPGIALLATVLTAAAAGAAVGVGDRPPNLRLSDARGRPVALADFAGKVVVIDLWASWCASCKTALPALDAIARRHAAAGLVVLAVTVDRERARADRFLAEHLPAPAVTVLYDPEGAALARLGAPGLPAFYLLDRTGVVRLVEGGYEAEKLRAVEAEIAALLAASP